MFKFDRRNLVFGLYLLVLVAIAQYVTDYFNLPVWPAFMVMIFYFVEQMDAKKAPHILGGAVAGIAGILLFAPTIALLTPIIGAEAAKIGLILVLIYAIVAFGETLPIVFNSYAFMFLTVTGVAVAAPSPSPFLWMAMAAVGGAVLIGGVILISKIMGTPITQPVAE